MKLHLALRQFAKVAPMAMLLLALELRAADWALPISGNLIGTVVDTGGSPQSGASVKLFNKFDRVVAKTFSSGDGRFAFAGLSPDYYSLQVSLDTFVPAFRDKIAVHAGSSSILQINLATLFSSVQLKSAIPSGAMSSDWKWVLRSSPATRPITRFVPSDGESETASAAIRPQLFSGTRMSVGISSGDAGLIDSGSATSDIGTQFALATNVYGRSALQLGGRVGQSTAELGSNSYALCAIYTPGAQYNLASPPEISFSISQVRMIPVSPAAQEGPMFLRTMELNFYEQADLTDSIHAEYGAAATSVEYLQHASRISPFVRLTDDLGRAGTLLVAYSDGGRPDELTSHSVLRSPEPENVLDEDLAEPVNALARMPQISEKHNTLEMQRTQNAEVGYAKSAGSRTYSFSTFYERVSNGRINVSGDLSALNSMNLLSDGVSTTSIYNIGKYQRTGFMASVDQKISNSVTAQATYGRMGGLSGNDVVAVDQLHGLIGTQDRNIASIGLRTHIAHTGTRISAHYGWVEPHAVMPQHTFTTQNVSFAPGLNIAVRQALPGILGLPGHLELTADVRNMLSQGYLPIEGSNGQQLLIVESPTIIRGGLSLTF